MPSPVDAVTTADPYPYYARLVTERPLYLDDGLGCWVAADAATVAAVLAEPAWRVRPAAEPVPRGIAGTVAGEVFGDLVRMTDGAYHERMKGLVGHALAHVDRAALADLAKARARQVLDEAGEPLRAAMFGVPAAVVAELCGLDERSGAAAAELTGEFVQCLPASATAEQQATAARAARDLRRLMSRCLESGEAGLLAHLARGGGHHARPSLSNAIGLLSQTYDATAGLIGNTLLAMRREGVPEPDEREAFVREVARHDSPVHNTRRFAAQAITLAGEEFREGQSILLLLAAANRDPAVNPDPHAFRPDRADTLLFSFGASRHACPGQAPAITITAAVVGELLVAGYDPATIPAIPTYLPSANLRVPALPADLGVRR